MSYTLPNMKLTDITDLIGVTNTNKDKPIEPEEREFNREKLGPKKVLMTWEAVPETPKTSLDPRYQKTFMIIGVVVGALLLIMGEIFLLILIGSIAFFTYAMTRNPLEKFKYELTSHGISVAATFYYWDEMDRFFFTGHYGAENLAVDLREGMPSRLIIAYNPHDKDKIRDIMNEHLPYLEKEPLNFIDRAYKSIYDRFDFEGNK